LGGAALTRELPVPPGPNSGQRLRAFAHNVTGQDAAPLRRDALNQPERNPAMVSANILSGPLCWRALVRPLGKRDHDKRVITEAREQKMKARKAIKRLQRVETLLGTVIDEFAGCTPEMRTMLNAAKSNAVSASEAAASLPKPAAGTAKDRARKSSGSNGKQLLVQAKERRAAAKREDKSTMTKPSRMKPVAKSSAAAS
jgi:hypothetical protein